MKTHCGPIAPNITTIIRSAIGFICMVLFYCSCEKSNLEYIDPGLATIEKVPTLDSNQFSLVLNHCFAGGANVTVAMDNPHQYTFRWEVNGKYVGQDISTNFCSCGGMAKVTITRLSDKASSSKSIGLPDCNPGSTR